MSRQLSFCVIGGGIMGFSSAYCLAKKFPECNVTLFYEDCNPNTTSNHGFGNCMLRHVNDFDHPLISIWTKQTVEYCADVFRRSPKLADEMGIHLRNSYYAYDFGQKNSEDINAGKLPEDAPYDMQELDAYERNILGFDVNDLEYVFKRKGTKIDDLKVYHAKTWVIDNDRYLPWLKRELEKMADSGHISSFMFVKKRINDFSEVSEESYDLIVNCSGLGSEYLVPDSKIVPVRGQYVHVRCDKDLDIRVGRETYICPKPGRVALGSVYQVGRRDTNIYPSDREDILRRCYALNPKLKGLEIIKEDVGIRPARYGGARVEVESSRAIESGVCVPIVHNYGHGAKGIMQHWGCALEVVKLATAVLERQP